MTGAEVSGTNTATHTADTPQLLLEHHLKGAAAAHPPARVRQGGATVRG
jgi:hypothetical protein